MFTGARPGWGAEGPQSRSGSAVESSQRPSPHFAHRMDTSCTALHRRANMAHTRQSRPDSGLGLQVKVLNFFGESPHFFQIPPKACALLLALDQTANLASCVSDGIWSHFLSLWGACSPKSRKLKLGVGPLVRGRAWRSESELRFLSCDRGVCAQGGTG